MNFTNRPSDASEICRCVSIVLHDYNNPAWGLQPASITAAYFYLVQLPGNCGTVVLHHLGIATPFLRKGLGTLALEMAQDLAHDWNYRFMVCTSVDLIFPKMAQRAGWMSHAEQKFQNVRTSRWVQFHSTYLNRSDRQYGFTNSIWGTTD